ncbi:MAG TPA: hypothetical protein PL124_09690 [Candidatus Cloacimonadota bacterium]|nr:hypothetical protein [Candidatus Cloacimonadota bacterium]HPS39671.1 hypothetical protein [Candidatus Cloacimonadota bacterium]
MTKDQIVNVIKELCIKAFGKNAVIDCDFEKLAEAMLTKCAIYRVDPRLCLAQGIAECHFGVNPEARRSRKTRNIWNVGNVDDGGNRFFASYEAGMDVYLRLMSREYRYPAEGNIVTPEMMIRHDFVRPRGGRYATAPSYTKVIEGIVKKVDEGLQGTGNRDEVSGTQERSPALRREQGTGDAGTESCATGKGTGRKG